MRNIGRCRHVGRVMHNTRPHFTNIRRVFVMSAALLVLVAACSQDDGAATPPPVTHEDPAAVYDPVRAGEEPPLGFRQLLGRDQIAPVYDPVYVARDEVDWPADSLVLGVAGVQSAKAFPITHLNQREMVIDSLEGIPILVTW